MVLFHSIPIGYSIHFFAIQFGRIDMQEKLSPSDIHAVLYGEEEGEKSFKVGKFVFGGIRVYYWAIFFA